MVVICGYLESKLQISNSNFKFFLLSKVPPHFKRYPPVNADAVKNSNLSDSL